MANSQVWCGVTAFTLLCGLLIPQLPAVAEADGPDYWGLKKGAAPVMYSQPKTSAKVMMKLPAGAMSLKNEGCQGAPGVDAWAKMTPAQQKQATRNMWCKVSFNGKTGWLPQNSLQEGRHPGPSFNCAKASGQVEKLICSDAELSKLDTIMDGVYKKSIKVAQSLGDRPAKAVSDLKADQIGWIKGRNDCWKSNDVRTCVKGNYENQISTLQVKWALVKSDKPQRYECPDRGEFYVTNFHTTVLPSVAVEYGDKREAFVATPTGSGTRYEGEFGKYVWIKGNDATFVWDQYKPEQQCKRQ